VQLQAGIDQAEPTVDRPRGRLTGRVVEGISGLPAVPTVLAEILSTLEDDNATASTLERLIRRDQALSSKLLSVANSAYYGFVAPITTLKRAVVVLGLGEVRKLCLGAGVFNLLHSRRVRNQARVEALWTHSLAVAEAARIIAARTKRTDPEQAFTGGLLHDLGKLVLAAFFPEELEAVAELAQSEAIPFHQAEAELGVDHEDLGIQLAEHWRLPPMLAEVMGRHHEPYPGLGFLNLVAAVHVGDCLAHQVWPDHSPAVGRHPFPEALGALALGEEGLWWVRRRLEKRGEAIDQLRASLT
jgi:putative nucleotidyltransferase with HDIG domain